MLGKTRPNPGGPLDLQNRLPNPLKNIHSLPSIVHALRVSFLKNNFSLLSLSLQARTLFSPISAQISLLISHTPMASAAAAASLETLTLPRARLDLAYASSPRSSLSIRGGDLGLGLAPLPQFTGLRVCRRLRKAPSAAGATNPKADRRSAVICELQDTATEGKFLYSVWIFICKIWDCD